MKRAAILFILIIFLAISASADMVSFFIVETGLPVNPDNAAVHQHSVLWENAFMDVFFDAGFIVSNAPILRIEKKPSGDILKAALISMSDAREWSIDYILVTQLDYPAEETAPSDILFFLYRTSPEEKILEKSVKRNFPRTARNEYEELKTIVRGLIPYIQ